MMRHYLDLKGRGMFAGCLIMLTGIVTAVIFASHTLSGADEQQEFPEEIIIDNPGYKSQRKGPVIFSHSEHAGSYDISCDACHHVYEDGKNIWEEGQPVAKCAVCHKPVSTKDRIKKLSVAFHGKCKGCHAQLAAEGDASAPYRQCNGCHE